MQYRHAALLTIGTTIVGCASTPPQATTPTSTRFADVSARRAQYEAYKLTRGEKWQRRDGAYSWDEIEDLAKQYPETEKIYAASNTRGTVIGCAAGVGAGLISGRLTIWGLRQGEGDSSLSSDTSVAFLATGGGLLLVALIASAAWPNPADTFADTYNGQLRRDLGIDEEPSKEATGSVWKPRALGNGGYGWAF